MVLFDIFFFIESILRFSFIWWCGNLTVLNRNCLANIVKTVINIKYLALSSCPCLIVGTNSVGVKVSLSQLWPTVLRLKVSSILIGINALKICTFQLHWVLYHRYSLDWHLFNEHFLILLCCVVLQSPNVSQFLLLQLTAFHCVSIHANKTLNWADYISFVGICSISKVSWHSVYLYLTSTCHRTKDGKQPLAIIFHIYMSGKVIFPGPIVRQ